MAIIRIPRKDFSLKQNPNYLPRLEMSGISKQEYREYVEPFLNNLTGFYFVPNRPQLTRLGIFPQLTFVRYADFLDIIHYTSEKQPNLMIPIQDRNSDRIGSAVSVEIDPYKENLFKRGMKIQLYDKQTGSINFSRRKGIEKRIITLSDITTHIKIMEPISISDEAIDDALRRQS